MARHERKKTEQDRSGGARADEWLAPEPGAEGQDDNNLSTGRQEPGLWCFLDDMNLV